ncbi:MAG: VCBS repeat-containing protein [Myxococcales bacterium]|nr:VCBS repeat-containing protein [Myxococcales bacterium]
MHRVGTKLFCAGALLWMAGCDCGGQKPRELLISFVKPTDGQQLTANDDLDSAAPGVQVDVEVTVTDKDGAPVTLESAVLATKLTSEVDWVAGPEGSLEEGKATFARTTLQARANQLRVTVREPGAAEAQPVTITVNVGAEGPALSIASPAEGQILRAADDASTAAGYQLKFVVDAPGFVGATGKVLCDQVCGLPPVSFSVGADGKAVAEATLTESACDAESPACYAVVTNSAGAPFSSQVRKFTVDSVAPSVEISTPVKPVATATFRIEAAVGCAGSGATATLTSSAGVTLTAPVSAGMVGFTLNASSGPGTYSYVLAVTDSSGNKTSRNVDVVVASAAPVVSLAAPATVTADANGDSSDGVQASVSATLPGETAATELRYWTSVTGALGSPRGVTTTQSGADRVATFLVDVAEGSNSLKVCATNIAGLETCEFRNLAVSTGRPQCRITSPLDSESRSFGGSLSVTVESVPGNVTVTAYDSSGQPTASAPTQVVAGRAVVSLALPADGDYRLLASCPAGGKSQQLRYRRDSAAPTISSAVVRGDSSGQGTLGPTVADTSVLPGRQVVLDVTTDPGAQVLVSGCKLVGASSATADATGKAEVREITIGESGSCALTVKARDAAGNEGTTQVPLTLAFQPAQVDIADPAFGSVLGSADGTPRSGGGLTVPVTVSIGALSGTGKLRLLANGNQVGEADVQAGDSTKTFAKVDLDEGANLLQAILVNSGGLTSCAIGTVYVKTSSNTVTLSSPSTAAPVTYNISFDLDRNTPGLQLSLGYSLTGATAGVRVDICTDVPLTKQGAPCADGSGWFALATQVPPINTSFTYPEGKYRLRAVVVDGTGTFPRSADAVLTVDTERPRVVALALVGDANGDRKLNQAESPSGDPQLVVATAGLPDGAAVSVKNKLQRATVYGTGTVANGLATIGLAALPNKNEADYELAVELVDDAGNRNKLDPPAAALDPVNTDAFASVRVDRVPPVLQYLSPAPSRTVLGPGDDADGNSANGTFVLRVVLQTSADVTSAAGVQVTRQGTTPRTYAPDGQLQVTDDTNLTASGTATYVFDVQATDEALNVTTLASRSITVDLQPPAITITAPTAGTYNTSTQQVNVAVTDGEGQVVKFFTTLQGLPESQIGTATVSGGVAQVSHSFADGSNTLRAEVTDAAGNLASDTEGPVVIDTLGCSVVFTSPQNSVATLNIADDLTQVTPGLQYQFKGVTSDCKGLLVTLYKGSPGTQVGSALADGTTGAFVFNPVTLADAEQAVFRAEMDDGVGNLTFDTVNVTVDITRPTISTVSPAGPSLFVVADSNINLRPTPAPGYVVDLVPDGDAQLALSFAAGGALNGTAQVSYRGTALLSPAVAVDADPKTIPLPSLTLLHNTSGTLEIKVTDQAGNDATYTMALTIDVQPPAAPVAVLTIPAADERKANVNVTWGTVYDDGSNSSSGSPTNIDLRWTTGVVMSNGITTENEFFDTTTVRQAGGGLLGGSLTSYQLTSLPPLAAYFVKVRAIDERGNYSRFAGAAQTRKDNFWSTATVTNPTTLTGFAIDMVSNGDVNGDGTDDILLNAYLTPPGGAFILYGNSNLASATLQQLSPPSAASQWYGTDISVGNVGDDTNEGRPDVLVSAPLWSEGGLSNQGRTFLYFGRNAATIDVTSYVEFRGAGANSQLGRNLAAIGDTNGDGIGELMFSAAPENGGQGRIYMFYGRTKAAWLALASSGYVDVSPTTCTTANQCRILDGPLPVDTAAPSGNQYGRLRGYSYLGDLDGDAHGDFTTATSKEVLNKVFLFSGQTVKNKATSVPATDAIQVLTQGPNAGTSLNGFGGRVLSNVNLVGGAGKDLVSNQVVQNRVHLFADGTASGYATPPLTISGARGFGYAIAAGDLNADGKLDLIAGETTTSNCSAWVLYNRGVSGSEFDTSPGGSFAQSRLTAPTRLGISVVVGDYNGDGKPDLAAGDNLDGRGKVTLWY